MNDLLRGWPTLVLVAGDIIGGVTALLIFRAALPTYWVERDAQDKVKDVTVRTQYQRYAPLAVGAVLNVCAMTAQAYIWRHSRAYSAGLSSIRHTDPFNGWFMTISLFVPWISGVAVVMAAGYICLRRPSIFGHGDYPINFKSSSRTVFVPRRTDIVDRSCDKHDSSSDAP